MILMGIMFDEHLRILADANRRQILTSLLEESPRSVSVVRSDGGEEGRDGEKRQRQRVELRHVHLPKLEDGGLVGWNQESNVVTKGPEFGEIEPLLKLLVGGHDKFLEEGVA